jgi:hypothetical protein
MPEWNYGDVDHRDDYSDPKDYSAAPDYSDSPANGANPTAQALSEAETGSSKSGKSGHSKDIAAAERGGYYDRQAAKLDAQLSNLVSRSQSKQGKFSVRHRKGLIATTLIGLLGGGGLMVGFVFISGPMQLVHAMHFLNDAKNFVTDTQTALRYASNMPFLRAFINNNGGGVSEAVQRSRVGVVGNKLANNLMAPETYNADGSIKSKGGRLTRMGVTFDSGSLGTDRGMTIDYGKFNGNENFRILDPDDTDDPREKARRERALQRHTANATQFARSC